jgi:hypothetical protein
MNEECHWCGHVGTAGNPTAPTNMGYYHEPCYVSLQILERVREAFAGLTLAEAESFWAIMREELPQ